MLFKNITFGILKQLNYKEMRLKSFSYRKVHLLDNEKGDGRIEFIAVSNDGNVKLQSCAEIPFSKTIDGEFRNPYYYDIPELFGLELTIDGESKTLPLSDLDNNDVKKLYEWITNGYGLRMQNRIFIVRTRKEVADGDFESSQTAKKMEIVLHIDAIQSNEFDEDIKWLASSYEINVKSEEFQTDEGIKTFGVISKSEIPKLVKCLKAFQNRKMQELKKAVKIRNPDIYHIRYLAKKDGFLFSSIKFHLMDDLEYLSYILNGKKEDIIITESHFYEYDYRNYPFRPFSPFGS